MASTDVIVGVLRPLSEILKPYTEHTFNSVMSCSIVYLTLLLAGTVGVFAINGLFSSCPNYSIPPSLWWFLLGVISSLNVWYFGDCAGGNCVLSENIFVRGFHEYVIHVDSHVVYLLLLPPLLYEGALGTNLFKFRSLFTSALFLATIGVAFTAGVLGLLFQILLPNCFSNKYEPYLMGATLSSTDPVAVISVLKAMGFPQKIMTYFEGESLLNDGTSVVLFTILKELAMGAELGASVIFGKFLYLFFVSPVFGIIYGFTFSIIGRYLYHSHSTFEAIWFTVHCSMCFIIGEHSLGLSGPLASVAYGLFINEFGHRTIDRKSHHGHHEFVVNIATICEMLIFELSGAIVTFLILEHDSYSSTNVGNIFVDGFTVWLCMLVVRSSMFLYQPLLNWFGPYRLNIKEMALLWWGGLRGAIVLALAHMLYQEPRLSAMFCDEVPVRIAIAVGLNLVIQGQLFSVLVRLINAYPPNEYQMKSTEGSLALMDQQFHQTILTRFKGSGILQTKITNTTVANLLFVPISASEVEKGKDSEGSPSMFKSFFDMQRNVSDAQLDSICDLSGCSEFECGLGLRFFLPLYMKMTSQSGSNEDALNFTHDDTGGAANLLMAVMASIPQVRDLHVDIRGNHNYKRLTSSSILCGVNGWIKNVEAVARQRPLELIDSDRTVDLTEIITPKAIDDETFSLGEDEEAWKRDRLLKMKELEMSLVIANLAMDQYGYNYTHGLLHNGSYDILNKMGEGSLLCLEVEQERLRQEARVSAAKLLPQLQWELLKKELDIVKYFNGTNWQLNMYKKSGGKLVRLMIFRQCISDLEAIMYFIDVNERLLINRTGTYQDLFKTNPQLLDAYKDVITQAGRLLNQLVIHYSDVFHTAVFIFLSSILTREKGKFINTQMLKGHISDKASGKIETVIDRSITSLSDYMDFKRKDIRLPTQEES